MVLGSSREGPGADSGMLPCLGLAGFQELGPWPLVPVVHIALPVTACHRRLPGGPSCSFSLIVIVIVCTVLFVCRGGVGVVSLRKELGSFNQTFSRLPIWFN